MQTKTSDSLKKYELMVIVKALLPDDVRKKALDAVKKIIFEHKGAVKDTDIWGKKYLAYKIKGHSEGYYVVYKVELPAESVSEVNKELNLQPELLRYLLITDDEGVFSTKTGKKGSVIAFDKDIEIND